MKQCSFIMMCAAALLLPAAAFPVFGDDRTIDYESFILESFDGNPQHEWNVAGKNYQYEFNWKVSASRFAHEEFPKQTYAAAWPQALFGKTPEGQELKSLGIWGQFDRKGYNWIDVYPVKADGNEPFEIPIPGRISYLDIWVWGSNLKYTVDAYFRDNEGVIHTVPVGSIAYEGWKNLKAQIPANIPQSKRILPRLAALKFVKFRIWTTPEEKVDNFYIYFDQFKVLTDTFESLYDGNDLADPDKVQEIWPSN